MNDVLPMGATQRFVDTGKYLNAFADEVLVRCIQCEAAGTVTAQWGAHGWRALFQCTSCSLELKPGDWVGPIKLEGRQPCGYCGHKWLALSVELPGPPTNTPVTLQKQCSECGHETAVAVSVVMARPGDHGIDPHFGLPLRLSKETRFGTVWAYNPRHVEELLGYVSAKLRIRQNAGNGAMFSRLPKWMKSARHRGEIAKALSKLSAEI
jgi:DNA-directed RNA polymerase subunit RPC12/RpoP